MIQYDLAHTSTNNFRDKNYDLYRIRQTPRKLMTNSTISLTSEPSPNLNTDGLSNTSNEDSNIVITMINDNIENNESGSAMNGDTKSNISSKVSKNNQNNCRLNQRDSSTPTSYKASHSEVSDSTNDTSPSSLEENRTPKPARKTTTGINNMRAELVDGPKEPIIIEHLHSVGVDPLEVIDPAISENNFVKGNRTSKNPEKSLHSTVRDETLSYNTGRRHTTPHSTASRDSADLAFRHSLDKPSSRPIARSTFPSYNRRKATSTDTVGNTYAHDSTSSEINRMKNSLLVQRNMKKKRNILEDEKVLVGNKISEGHENFVMAYNMLTGIRVAVSRCSGIMKNLDDQDFRTTKKLSFNMDGSELTPSSKYDFKFKDYCPEVFRSLRSMFGIDPADYLISVTGKYILSELGSPGKSGSFFYYSRDYRFIIKTIHHGEHKQLRRILKDYYKHIKENPNTLISQFYGLHRVKMPFNKSGIKKVHFIVMNNLFPSQRDIHVKYDLKGSTWGRKYEVPEKSQSLANFTLKDLNWLERNDKIKFGPEKRKLFFEQLEKDVKLLQKINVMDYSLLLGIHDVKMGNNTDTIQRLSIFDPKSTDKYDLINTNPRDIDIANDLPNNLYPGRLKYIFYGHDGGIRATNELNEPLGEIYYLGIIDCLTNYSLKKRLETMWRSIGHSRSTISAVPAKEYGDRFLKFIKDGTTNIKTKIK
ncbi:DEHA2F18062p [Debaryomyces hansenii CBS767]|uniref:1-phosphatidylinositol-4-phosphate 5-kinase n=1 Tax=Debaryomyces hansenii (strain ATCC 36239 / CBS 767 / BCRC 21394 / JCM 1990 / NBRC 0083 / IGC 2968) TaxID=284592 RepID=Q6BKX7_DEBHA|nr:DEHA2F18062p [Debaryomyces hansenii CBS767]CAG89527.2 DEHA2F18062p [Debaryomyces hansenii CBS767]|eukprot:XP_461144.2 DEHA2F18062p [Debaryomyces hansenii CBS767]